MRILEPVSKRHPIVALLSRWSLARVSVLNPAGLTGTKLPKLFASTKAVYFFGITCVLETTKPLQKSTQTVKEGIENSWNWFGRRGRGIFWALHTSKWAYT